MLLNKFNLFKKHHIINRIASFLIFLLVLSLLFSKAANGLLIILISSLWLVGGDYKAKWEKIKESRTIVLILFYLVNVFGLLYTANLDTGSGILVKRIALLIIPLVFAYFVNGKKMVNKITSGYLLACLVAVTYSLGQLSYWFLTENEVFLAEFNSHYIYNYYREVLCMPLGLHPTYFSIYLLFGVILVLPRVPRFWDDRKFFSATAYIFIGLYLLVFSFFLASRMPLIAFFLVFLVAFTTWAFLKRRYFLLVVMGALLGFGLYKAYNHPILSQRFKEMRDTPWKPPRGIHHNSTNIRIGILICTAEEIKNHLIWGTGTGDMQDVLNGCYASNEYSNVLYQLKYNTHNMFLDAQLMLGILGLGALLFMIAYGFRLALQSKNYIYGLFLLFWCICGISESLLNTQKGIVFFSAFNTLFFLASYYKLKERKQIGGTIPGPASPALKKEF